MSLMDSIVSEDVLRATTWTLVHFLWQGTIIAVALALVTRMFRFSATARYAGGIAALAVMLAAPVLTMALITPAASRQAAVAARIHRRRKHECPLVELAVRSNHIHASRRVVEFAAVTTGSYWFTVVPAFWMTGVLIFALRLTGGWMLTRRLALDGVSALEPHIATLARNVAARLALRRLVRVAVSSRVTVPMMFGWIRPIILLPAATIAGLTPVQLEALIAHELVHVRRHDFIVNVLQMIAETVLFFHPAIWWVSRYIRCEREHCCDDAVVEVCDRVDYVSALTHLGERWPDACGPCRQ